MNDPGRTQFKKKRKSFWNKPRIGENPSNLDSNQSEYTTCPESFLNILNNDINRRVNNNNNQTTNIPCSSSDCIFTSVLPDNFSRVFKFSYFNRMQSEAFNTLYNSNSNVVVSAPTGSGKTVLFELAMMRLIKEWNNNNNTDTLQNVKIFYIAPTKSLCFEKYQQWGKTFLNLTVGILTSDTSLNESEKVKRCNIIITTAEKLDILTRKWSDYKKLFQLVKLVLVDEIHSLKDTSRGATLETIITRLNYLCENIRIIAISATLPNIDDIASWLRQKVNENFKPAISLSFNESYRPVQIEKSVQGYNLENKNDFQKDIIYNTKLPNIIENNSQNKPVLVFCPTRASTVSTANYLAQHLSIPEKGKNQKNDLINDIGDKTLRSNLLKQVAYHHAGLSVDERNTVEKLFKNGKVRVLCCTSTLAVGVNLPAYLVIIKGTKCWNSSTIDDYSQLDILQMIGRAGRPQYETEAKAVIVTDSSSKDYYQQLVDGTEILESSLHKELLEHLNAEISIGTIDSPQTAFEWIEKTFFYIRYTENPGYYNSSNTITNNKALKDSNLFQFIKALLEELQNTFLINIEPNPSTIPPAKNNPYMENNDLYEDNFFYCKVECTPYGHAMAKHYILFETMKGLIFSKLHLTLFELLQLVSRASEYKTIKVRRSEKRLYKNINLSPLTKYKLLTDNNQSKIIDQSWQKISLTIQYELGGLEFPSYQGSLKLRQPFLQDKSLIFRHIFRVLKCAVDVFIIKKDGISLKEALFLLRSCTGYCWEGTAMTLRQISNVGLVAVRRLASKNVVSLQMMKKLSEGQIGNYLGLQIDKGYVIKNDLKSLPQLRIRVKLDGNEVENDGIKLKFKVEIISDIATNKWHDHYLSANVEITKISGELLDFRRISINQLNRPKSFTINVVILSIEDDIEFSVHCQEVAGIGDVIIFKAKELDETIIKQLEKSKNLDALNDCFYESEENNSSDDSLMEYLNDLHDKNKTTDEFSIETDISSEMAKANTSRKLISKGVYECKHQCHDKTSCRHYCCREGIPLKASLENQKVKKKSENQKTIVPESITKSDNSSIQKNYNSTKSFIKGIQPKEWKPNNLNRQQKELLPIKNKVYPIDIIEINLESSDDNEERLNIEKKYDNNHLNKYEELSSFDKFEDNKKKMMKEESVINVKSNKSDIDLEKFDTNDDPNSLSFLGSDIIFD